MQGPSISGTPQRASVSIERTAYGWGIAVVAALGGLLFGYDWVVIGGARQFYVLYFRLSYATLIGWANSCALLAGYLANRIGRRRVLLVAAVLFALSSVLTGWASSFESFIVWRIAGGI